jgi:hypothetical protein
MKAGYLPSAKNTVHLSFKEEIMDWGILIAAFSILGARVLAIACSTGMKTPLKTKDVTPDSSELKNAA